MFACPTRRKDISENPTVKYIIEFVNLYLTEHFDDKIAKKFKINFLELLRDEFDERIAINHLINPPFMISLYESIIENVTDLDEYGKHVIIIYENLTKIIFDMQLGRVKNAKNHWKHLVSELEQGNTMLYTNDLFKFNLLTSNADRYHFELKNCYYFDVFKRRGYAHLGSILCDYDLIMARTLKDYSTFSRNYTIARGAGSCDFFFDRK